MEGWESSQNEIMSSGKVVLIQRGAGGDVISRECVLSLVLGDWGLKVARGGGLHLAYSELACFNQDDFL